MNNWILGVNQNGRYWMKKLNDTEVKIVGELYPAEVKQADQILGGMKA